MSLIDNGNVSPRLLRALVSPSYLSGIIALLVGVAVIAVPPLLLHLGTAAQQGFLGLNILFRQTSETAGARALSTSFLSNHAVGNVVFFAFWGSVGLGVYLVAENVARELGRAVALAKEFGYLHIIRHKFIQELFVRVLIRVLAIVAWWLLLRLLVYKLIPYGSAAATHTSKAAGFAVGDWLHSILLGAACALTVHCMAILLRLMFLRPRLFGMNPVSL